MYLNPIRALLLFVVSLSVHVVAAPVNDSFSNRVVVSGDLPVTVSGSNVDGTLETGEANQGGASVWYSWTAPATRHYDLRLLNPDFDSSFGVFTGTSPGALELVLSSSTVTPLAATAGTTYQIAVYGLHGTEGKFDLRIREFFFPTNDHFANRIVIPPALPATVTGSNVDATREASETIPDSVDQSSVWYSWTAPASGAFEVSLLNPGFKSTLCIYTGNLLKSLTSVGFGRERERLTATAGTTYQIAVMGNKGGQGEFQLSIRGLVPPGNDDFANSIEIPAGLPTSLPGWNVGATLEPGEVHPENYENQDTASVWYRWTAPATGQFKISLADANFEARIKAYTGESLEALQFTPSVSATSVTVTATAGTVFRIAVLGNSSFPQSREGEYQLAIRDVTPATHDSFSSPILLTGGLPISKAGTNFGATLEAGEPDQYYDGASVWYRWTASVAGKYEFKITQEDFDSELFVFTGNSLNTLARIPTQNAWTTVTATAGITYQIAVHGNYGFQGNFQLTIRKLAPPTNDNFASSNLMSGSLPLTRTGSTVDASLEVEEPTSHADYGPSVWYHWTASSTGNHEVSLPTSTYGSLFRIYRGTSLGSLTFVSSGTSRVILPTTSGTVYRIAVMKQYGRQPGPFQLAIRALVPPANDHFANRVTVPAGLPHYLYGSNFGSTGEAGGPDALNTDKTSVWYSWTAPASGSVEIRDLYSDFAPRFMVFTGNSLGSLTQVGASSRVRFNATAGTTYQFMINGTDGLQGRFRVMISQALPALNDHFADRTVITGNLPLTQSGSSVGSTLEPGEPSTSGYGGTASVWYSWTAPAAGSFRIGFLGDVSPVVRIFTGDSLATLAEVASGYNNRTITTTAGTTYQIAFLDAPVGYQFTIRDVTPPVNNSFADRIAITEALPVSVAGSNVNATTESYEKNPGYQHGASIWYRWTAPANGRFKITTVGSSFDTVLQVCTGAELMTQQIVGTNDDADTTASSLIIEAEQGVEYQIAIYGYKMATGSTLLNLSAHVPGIGDWTGLHGLVGAASLPGATPKDDGIPNLLKYAFNLPPGIAASGIAPYLAPESGTAGLPLVTQADGVLTMEYLRSRTAPDLVYRPQFSSTLAPSGADGWVDATGDEEVVPMDSNWERVIIRDSAPGPVRFGRVLVELDTVNP